MKLKSEMINLSYVKLLMWWWCADVVRALSLFLLLSIRISSSSCLVSASRKTQKKTEIIHSNCAIYITMCHYLFTKGYHCLFFLFYTYRNLLHCYKAQHRKVSVPKKPSFIKIQCRVSSFRWYNSDSFTKGYHCLFFLFYTHKNLLHCSERTQFYQNPM